MLQSLRKIGEAARTNVDELQPQLNRRSLPADIAKVLKDPFIKTIQFSDTLVIAAGRRPRQRSPLQKDKDEWMRKYELDSTEFENAIDAFLRYLVCKCASSVLKVAALCDIPILYRGVITVGRFEIDDNFLLGPAVDEAAELMDIADGPFVWLAPSANRLEHCITEGKGDLWKDLVIKHQLPLKDGRHLPTRVVHPFLFCSKGERATATRKILDRMTSNRIEIAIKKSNFKKLIASINHHEYLKKLKANRDAEKNTS